jgi:hypothetical protein
VVQVMFTVPKEKLRVVNADQLSLLSKSDVDFEGGENEGEVKEVKRMSSVVEKEESEVEVGQAVTTDLDIETPPLPQQEFIEVAKRSDKGKGKEILRKAVGTPPKRVLPMPKYLFEELS